VTATIEPTVHHDDMTAYLDAVRHGSRSHAVDIALRLLERGVPAEDVLVELVALGQSRVGVDWELGRWSVAQEHRATAIADAVIGAVAAHEARGPVGPRTHGRMLVLSPEGEWHTLQSRLAAEVMRLNGIDVTLVTPSLPSAEIAAFLGDDPAHVVAVPCSLAWNLVGAWRTIGAVRAAGSHVLVGGRGYGHGGAWATSVGADVWAGDLRDGAREAARLLLEPPAERRAQVADDVARLEIAQLRRDGPAFVEAALQAVSLRWPTFWHDVEATVQVREDLDVLVRALASSVLVADPRLIVDTVTWFERVVATRGHPLAMVSGALVLLHETLPPRLERSRAMARAGLDACSQAPF
jgi:methanogenic corrinoid protein MtbC1